MDLNNQNHSTHEEVLDIASKGSVFRSVQKITAWVMIISAVLFALVGILAIWQVFGDNVGDPLGRAFGSLLVIAFASLIVNVASRTGDSKH